MKNSKLKFTWIFIVFGILFFPNNTFAQKDNEVKKKKIVIVKKTVDKDGNEMVEKIIKQGAEAENFDLDKFIKIESSDKDVNVNVEVEMVTDGDKNNETKKSVEVTVDGENVIIMDGSEKTVIKIDGNQERKEIKTEDGKHIIIMRKDGDGMDIDGVLEEIDIEEMGEGGKKQIRIMRTHKKGNGAFFGVMVDPSEEGLKLLDVVKDSPAEKKGLKKGDVIKRISEHSVSNYEDLTNALGKYKPGETIIVLYESDGEVKKASVTLADSKDMPKTEKMIWKTEDGEIIEIREDHEILLEEEIEEHHDGEKKIIKKKKVIKKKKGDN